MADLVDTLAATLFRWKGNHWGSTMLPYPSCPEADACRKGAAMLLSALESAGYRVVPIEPTEAMAEAGARPIYGYDPYWDYGDKVAREVWPEMLAAAPKVAP